MSDEYVFQVRFHGRGGQGVVTSAELLSVAAFLDGREAQAFPSFGSERMGAPVMAFCRIADVPIRVREPVTQPDAVVVADATLLHHVQLFAGLGLEGYALINSARSWDELGLAEMARRHYLERLATIPATDIARRHASLLGALAGLTHVVSIDALERAVRERFTGAVADGNVAAARAAYDYLGSAAHA